MDLPTWILEKTKGGSKKNKGGKEYWLCKEHHIGKVQWVHRKPEGYGKYTGTSPRVGGGTKPLGEGDSKNNMTPTKELKAGILSIKDQSDVQDFLYQFNRNTQGNE